MECALFGSELLSPVKRNGVPRTVFRSYTAAPDGRDVNFGQLIKPVPRALNKDGSDDKPDPANDGDKPNQAERKGGKDEANAGKDNKKPRSKLPFIILGIVVLLAAIGAAIYYFATIDLIDTDDAYTEGRAVSMAAKVAGYVIDLRVDDNTPVKAGDLLLRIDPRDYVTARDQARANLSLAQAQLASGRIELDEARVRAPASLKQAMAMLEQARANQGQSQRDYKRQQSVDPRATTQQNLDQANFTFRGNTAAVGSAQAQVEAASVVTQTIADAEATVKQREAMVGQAAANLTQAELNLSYTEIRAPQDGKITMRNVELGTYVQVGQQLFYLVTPDTWVVANFKEGQLARMCPGQPVTMSVDAYPGMKLRGHVESVQQGSGARFSAFPAQNATGNFVKIVRRVPVKITLDSGYDRQQGLPLGISVLPTVNVR